MRGEYVLRKYCKCLKNKIFLKELFATNSNFIIPIYLEPDGVNL